MQPGKPHRDLVRVVHAAKAPRPTPTGRRFVLIGVFRLVLQRFPERLTVAGPARVRARRSEVDRLAVERVRVGPICRDRPGGRFGFVLNGAVGGLFRYKIIIGCGLIGDRWRAVERRAKPTPNQQPT
ncbi:MAG TPA: hypothetical protein VIL37_01795 [Natronosporangium sp.]